MSINAGLTWQALLRFGTGAYDYSTNTFKLAFYTESASLSRDTTAYTATEEYSGAGYTAGGFTLTNVTPVVANGELRIRWADLYLGASMTPRGAMVYNTSVSNEAVFIVDFGSTAARSVVRSREDGVIAIRA